jgi:CPA1 family monovalent cation:H+ antiporter
VGVVGAAVLRVTPDPLTTILASTVIVFTSSLAAEHLLASPVIAVVVTGMILGAAARQHLEPARVLALNSFWETAGFVVNVFLFLLVGMQIEASMLWREAVAILLALVALHVGRAAAVYGSFGVMRLLRPDPVPLRFQHVMVFGNIKGALSMAAVLALPPDLPFRARIVTIVFGVTFVTLLTQALPFRAFLRAMGVVIPASDLGWEDARATLIAARRGQLELDELLAAGLVARHEHAERRAAFQQEIIRAERVLRAAPETEDDPLIAQVVLLGQKAALADAVRRGLVSEEAAATRIDEIDRKLVAASVHHGGD